MRYIFYLSALLFCIDASAYEVSDLMGTWKSNEKKTLNSMESVSEIPEKTREFFQNDFFGKLVVVVKKGESAVYFFDDKPETLEFMKHRIDKVSDSVFKVKYENENGLGSEIHLEGQCYTVVVSKWKFKEYFCRVE